MAIVRGKNFAWCQDIPSQVVLLARSITSYQDYVQASFRSNRNRTEKPRVTVMVEGAINDHNLQRELKDKFDKDQYLPDSFHTIREDLAGVGRTIWGHCTGLASAEYGNWNVGAESSLRRAIDGAVVTFNRIGQSNLEKFRGEVGKEKKKLAAKMESLARLVKEAHVHAGTSKKRSSGSTSKSSRKN